jgi:ubiquinone/menaquinone biosynthesis C-methylase UbiE
MMPSSPKLLPEAYNDDDYKRMSAKFDDSSPYFTDGNKIFRLIHESAHRKIADWMSSMPVGGWICDIGCGQGYHYQYVRSPERVIGLDIRLDSLRRVREISNRTPLIQADSCSLPFKSGAITRALSIYAFEHIYYLRDTLAETARILAPKGKMFVGLPCEGGLAWTLGRKLTSEHTMSRRYNVDYRKYIALEHCNTAPSVINALKEFFELNRRSYFPLPMLPAMHINLTVALALTKR